MRPSARADAAAFITTLAGDGSEGYSGDGGGAAQAELDLPEGIAIDPNDTIYVSDSESNARVHPGWLRGIRIGNLRDGHVTMFIPPHKTDAPEGAMGEGIAVDAAGNIYTAEANIRGVTKYVRN